MSSYVEKTVINAQFGFSSGLVLGDNWEVGGFYQKQIGTQQYHEATTHPDFEENYFGAYAQHPISFFEGIPLYLNVRAGIMNGKKILIAPSLRYQVYLSKKLCIDTGIGGAGIGSGNFRPTMFFGFKFRT